MADSDGDKPVGDPPHGATTADPATGTGLDGADLVHENGTVALRGVTLLAGPGELLAVLGPSGSGKSTLLRAIAGLTPLTRGRVLIGGVEAVGEGGFRDVAMVFQASHLIPFLDVAGNLAFPLELRHVPAEQSRLRIDEQARGLGLSRLMRRRPQTLSPGETARVAMGKALVRTPRVFLLDEPLAHLDAGERLRLRHHLRDTLGQAGVTTLYVTNDPAEAMSVGQRVAVLDAGTLVQVATPRTLYDAPANRFVAELVAAPMGFLAATTVISGGLGGYRVGTRVLPTWQPAPAALTEPGRPVLLGLRAEDVHEVPNPDHATVTGRVAATEHAGPHITVWIDVDGQRLVGRFGRRSTVGPGDLVTVGVDAARAHVFDPGTGATLASPSTE